MLIVSASPQEPCVTVYITSCTPAPRAAGSKRLLFTEPDHTPPAGLPISVMFPAFVHTGPSSSISTIGTGKKSRLTVTMESQPGRSNVSTPSGFDSSYIVPFTTTEYPSPSQPVYNSSPSSASLKTRLIVTVESHPFGPVNISVPVGFDSS